MRNGNEEQTKELLNLVREALEQDKVLREKYQIGDKFRFIRDRLQALLSRVQENLESMEKKKEERGNKLLEDEVLVYVYLYNAHGIALPTWQKMLLPTVFYEYSVNRPIYTDKSHVEAFIRSKTNKTQHGYLTVAVKKQDILQTSTAKDLIGNLIVKVKEGSLKANRLVAFTHNDQDYKVSEDGQLVKKP